MIFEVEGDILLSKAALIVHGVAPGDHFNQGLALALRESWPALYKDFRHHCQGSHPKAGELWMWHGPGVNIATLFTQEPAYDTGAHAGPAHIEFVNHALRALRHEIDREKYASVAMPRLATGVGRLSWEEVKPLVERHLGTLQVPVFTYTQYRRGLAAVEPGVEQTTAS